jgi:hypothetical protein
MNATHLAHLTLVTGDLRMSPRSEVSAEALRALSPLVSAGMGEIPGMPGLYAEIRRGQGQASITIGLANGQVALVAVLAWEPAGAQTSWGAILSLARDGAAIATVLRQPDHLPWLAVTMAMPSATLSPEQLIMLGDLERCLAWAILEEPA